MGKERRMWEQACLFPAENKIEDIKEIIGSFRV
jgi:hypothetical protein